MKGTETFVWMFRRCIVLTSMYSGYFTSARQYLVSKNNDDIWGHKRFWWSFGSVFAYLHTAEFRGIKFKYEQTGSFFLGFSPRGTWRRLISGNYRAVETRCPEILRHSWISDEMLGLSSWQSRVTYHDGSHDIVPILAGSVINDKVFLFLCPRGVRWTIKYITHLFHLGAMDSSSWVAGRIGNVSKKKKENRRAGGVVRSKGKGRKRILLPRPVDFLFSFFDTFPIRPATQEEESIAPRWNRWVIYFMVYSTPRRPSSEGRHKCTHDPT